MKKNIGIITFHRAHNYGAMLQAYALQEYLSTNNIVKIIDYYNKHIYSNYNIIRPFSKNPYKLIKNLFYDLKNIKNKKRRYNSFTNFLNENLNLSTNKIYENNIIEEIKKYNIIITGSDQVWNPDIVGKLSDIFTLNLDVPNLKKISYAASSGSENYVKKYSKEFKEKLSSINNISVRERSTAIELKKIINKEVSVVLDPTFLLTSQEWDKKLSIKKSDDKKYILVYMVKYDQNFVNIVNLFSELTGLSILHFDLKNPGYKNVYKTCYQEGPKKFVECIKNAEYVLATSFHAVAFSLIYNKNFWVVPHNVTNSRVTNLLDELQLNDRIIHNLDEVENKVKNNKINYENVNNILLNKIDDSKKWLVNSIENPGDNNE